MRRSFVRVFSLFVLIWAGTALASLELNTPLAPDITDILVSRDGQRAFCITRSSGLFSLSTDGQWYTANDRVPLRSGWRAIELKRVDENIDTFLVQTIDDVTWSTAYHRTVNGGASFQVFEADSGFYLPSELNFDRINHNIAYGLSGSEFKLSNDGGRTWTRFSTHYYRPEWVYKDPLSDSLYWVYGFFNHNSEPYLQGGLIKSSNGGETWQQAIDFYEEWGLTSGLCNNIIRLSNGRLFAMISGIGGSNVGNWMVQSDDDGEHWALFPENAGIPRLAFSPNNIVEDLDRPGTLIITGVNGNGVFRSENYGTNWHRIDVGLPIGQALFADVLQTDIGSPLLITVTGYGIFESIDHGLTWHPRPSPRIGKSGLFSMSREVLFWHSLERQFILQPPFSEWQEIVHPQKPDTVVTVSDLVFLDDGRIAGTYVQNSLLSREPSSGIALSADSGETWSYRPPISTRLFKTNWVQHGGTVAVVAGIPFTDSIYVSLDTGRTWQARGLPTTTAYWDDQLLSVGERIYYSPSDDSHGHISYSDDLGESWSALDYIPSAWSIRDHRIFLRGEELFATQSGGRELVDSLFLWKHGEEGWQLLFGDSAGFDPSVFESFSDKLTVSFVSGSDSAIVVQVGHYKLMVSRDEGETWRSTLLQFPEGYNVMYAPGHIAHDASQRLWFNTSIGPCYLDYSELGLSSATIHPVLPLTPSLSAYPNPFNSNTQLQFSLPFSQDVSLTLYDALGRQVTTLVNERLAAGTHNANWQAEGVASGTYFARLKYGETQVTHKLVLIK